MNPPALKPCCQCRSLFCGPWSCRMSGLTHEQFHDWQNAEGPERVRDKLWESAGVADKNDLCASQSRDMSARQSDSRPMHESQADEDWRDDYRQRVREIAK